MTVGDDGFGGINPRLRSNIYITSPGHPIAQMALQAYKREGGVAHTSTTSILRLHHQVPRCYRSGADKCPCSMQQREGNLVKNFSLGIFLLDISGIASRTGYWR